MAFDPSYIIKNNPLSAPSEFKILEYRTYVNSAGDPLHCTREALQLAIETDALSFASSGRGSARYLFGTIEQFVSGEGAQAKNGESPHMACGCLELREDGLWAVDVHYHGEDHLAYSHVGPLVYIHRKTGALAINAFVFTSTAKASLAGLERTPWSASLYGSCAADFSEALCSLAECVTGWIRTVQRPVTVAQVDALEERIKTHLTTMKLNAEMGESLRRSGTTGEA